MSTRAPSLGRGCRAQRGGVGFLFCGEAASSLPSPRGKGVVSRKAVSSYRSLPHWGRGTAPAVDRVLSLIVDLRRISSLSFIPLVPYPARSARHLPHAGKALSVVILFLHVSCIRFDDRGIAVLSFRSLPHWGRGTASAVDRVLSQTAYLRRSSSLFFMPPSPSNLRPFGAPPSIGRRECPREPLPLEGAAERSEAGLASFFGGETATTI